MTCYQAFLETKRAIVAPVGFEADKLSPMLFPFQSDIVRWALRRGRAAIFADCGLGKTPMQLEWARQVCNMTGGRVLIFAPLAVSTQTLREGTKFGIGVTVCKHSSDVRDGINITNYERLEHFDPEGFVGVVLDESSILKSYDGVTRKALQVWASGITYRLCATATPAPNDLTELCNHAEFLSIMEEKEIKALFFTQDGNSTSSWRLKGHARKEFWKWMAQWSVALRAPSDLGYSDDGFVLPPLQIADVALPAEVTSEGYLIPMEAVTLQERRIARRDSLEERVARAAELVNGNSEPWVVWCNLNSESTELTKAIPGAVEVKGADSIEHKESSMLGFSDGKIRVLVTKPTICGFGMNWQHCANMVFVGLSDSYEQYYQAIRRCWRFGQRRPVTAWVVTSVTEGRVVANIKRKEKQASEMFSQIVHAMSKEMSVTKKAAREEMHYEEATESGKDWTLHLGDCVSAIDKVETESVGLSVFSPPFPGMYTYTNSAHDMGNTKSIDEMVEHFKFLVGPEKLLRVLIPGRSVCVHLTQAVAKKGVDGWMGIKDFRGRVIRVMEDSGWIYYGEVCIDKDPQVKAIRTNDHGLLFKSLANDSAKMHMALADYILQFKKPGNNPIPIRAGISDRYDNSGGWITTEEWIEWAAPVWYRHTPGKPGGIRETDVLNVSQARETDDERHLCPLQLGVIERCVKLWSAPGELVLSPFAGIGSEGYQALKLNRRFIGIELKRSYWKQAVRNLRAAEQSKNDIMQLLQNGVQP